MGLVVKGGGRLEAPAVIEPFIGFVLQKFIKRRQLRDTLEVEVRFTDTVHTMGNYGDCAIMDIERETKYPRKFRVRVAQHGLRFHQQLITLGHELVHVKQYALGEHAFVDDAATCRYKGETFTLTGKGAIRYYDRPWEIEAHGRERGLVMEFIERNKLFNAEWIDPFA
jgi:hypothetical protein